MTDIKNKDVLGAPLWRNYDITVSPNFVDHDTGQYGCAFAIPAKGKARLKSYPSGVAADPSMFSVQVITLYDGAPLVILIGPCPGVYVISIDYGGGYLNDYTVQLKDSPYFQLVKPNEDTHPKRLFILKENGLLLASGKLKYFFDNAPAGEPTTPVALDGTNSIETTSGGQSKAVFIASNVRTFEAVWDQLLYLTTDFKLYVWGYYYGEFGINAVTSGYHTTPQLLLSNVASFGQLWGGDGLVWSELNVDKVYAVGHLSKISYHHFPNYHYEKRLLFTQRTPIEDLEYRQKRWSPVGAYQGEISFDVTYPVNERRFINDYVKVRCFGDCVAIIDRFGDLYLGSNMLSPEVWASGIVRYWYTSGYNQIYFPVLSLSAQNVADVYRTGGYTFYCTEGDRKLFVAAGAKAFDQDSSSYSAKFTNNYQERDFSYDSRELIAGSKIQSFDYCTLNPDGYAKTTWYEIATQNGCCKLPCGRGGMSSYYPGAHCIGWLNRSGWPEYKGVNWFYFNLCKKHAFDLGYEAVFPYQVGGATDYSRWPTTSDGSQVSTYVTGFPYYEVLISGYVKAYENIFISDYNLIQVWSAYNAHYQDNCGLFVAGEVPYDMTIMPPSHESDTEFYQCVALSVTHFLAHNYLEVY